MMRTARARIDLYAAPVPRHDRGELLTHCMGFSLLVSTGLGLLLLMVDTTQMITQVRQEARRIQFHAPAMPLPALESVPEPEAPAPEPEPVELAPQTVLAQAIDRPTPAPSPPAVEPTVKPTPPPRRVYGVRRVLARGLGTGGAAAGHTGLVTKHGNALDGVADTLTATASDLAGELAALSTVERAPEPTHRVKPRYSEALIAARASGTVTARMLIDAAGMVKTVEVMEDFGLDSAAVAKAALSQFQFRPARRRGEPVAVWIIHRIRFEFQE